MPKKPRLIWTGAPMPSLSSAANALNLAGYNSHSIVNNRNSNTDDSYFDKILMPKRRLVKPLNTPLYLSRVVWCYIQALFIYDIYHCFFTGGILGNTPLRNCEIWLWRLSGGKHIVFAYGQDGFVYSDLPDYAWANELVKTYPRSRKEDFIFKKRIQKLCKTADCVVGCIVHNIHLPRIDVWPVLWYPAGKIDDISETNINDGVLRIAHPTNHRAIKGSDALVKAVENLKKEGLNISLDIIENVTIEQSRQRIGRADIIVDQLLMGYAMTALEGLSLGKLVISGFTDDEIYKVFYEKSYLGDCPILTANPDTIEEVLKKLYYNREEIKNLGKRGLEYFNKYHSDIACVQLFEAIYERIWHNKNIDLENMFTPLR